MVNLALGTDTGGSIRIPSSACGIVGMKPTFGLVSKKGVQDLAYTLDHVGPITNNVYDNALLLNIIAGYDSTDPYSIKIEINDYLSLIGKDIKDKVIGIPSFYFELIEEEVQEAMNNCIIAFENLGARIEEISIDCISVIAAAQAVTIKSEAAAAHMNSFEMYKGIIDTEVYERLEESREIKAYEYVQSQIERKKLINEYNQAFKHIDVLLAPTLPILPTDIGQREVTIDSQNELVRNALLRLTSITNYTGNPSISFLAAHRKVACQ
ncbi:amidase [Lysinibacillus fusiformis]|nr:amidase [Lysinibacillus fusiformis]